MGDKARYGDTCLEPCQGIANAVMGTTGEGQVSIRGPANVKVLWFHEGARITVGGANT